MDSVVASFLKAHRISVIGILQDDSTIHSATLHYAYQEDPLSFYFMTGRDSRKCRPLQEGKEVTASLVIGFSEEEFCTFQAEGTVTIVNDEDGYETYFSKYPNRREMRGAGVALLEFTPTWWRYTDMKTHPGTHISFEK